MTYTDSRGPPPPSGMRWVQSTTPPAPVGARQAQRYTVLGCCLPQMYRGMLDQLVDRSSKAVTATYCRAQHALNTVVKRRRPMPRATFQSFHTIG